MWGTACTLRSPSSLRSEPPLRRFANDFASRSRRKARRQASRGLRSERRIRRGQDKSIPDPACSRSGTRSLGERRFRKFRRRGSAPSCRLAHPLHRPTRDSSCSMTPTIRPVRPVGLEPNLLSIHTAMKFSLGVGGQSTVRFAIRSGFPQPGTHSSFTSWSRACWANRKRAPSSRPGPSPLLLHRLTPWLAWCWLPALGPPAASPSRGPPSSPRGWLSPLPRTRLSWLPTPPPPSSA